MRKSFFLLLLFVHVEKKEVKEGGKRSFCILYFYQIEEGERERGRERERERDSPSFIS